MEANNRGVEVWLLGMHPNVRADMRAVVHERVLPRRIIEEVANVRWAVLAPDEIPSENVIVAAPTISKLDAPTPRPVTINRQGNAPWRVSTGATTATATAVATKA
mgnify:CR=1 FL=1